MNLAQVRVLEQCCPSDPGSLAAPLLRPYALLHAQRNVACVLSTAERPQTQQPTLPARHPRASLTAPQGSLSTPPVRALQVACSHVLAAKDPEPACLSRVHENKPSDRRSPLASVPTARASETRPGPGPPAPAPRSSCPSPLREGQERRRSCVAFSLQATAPGAHSTMHARGATGPASRHVTCVTVAARQADPRHAPKISSHFSMPIDARSGLAHPKTTHPARTCPFAPRRDRGCGA